jgi:Domain of unknown function (DUF4234)
MARDVTIEDERYRIRHPLAVIGLTAVTLGLYFLYWYYRANDDARRYLREYEIRPIRSVLALLMAGLVAAPIAWMIFGSGGLRFPAAIGLTVLFVVPALISFRRTGLRVRAMQERAGVSDGLLSPGAAWLLLIFTVAIGGAYVQAGLDRVWTSPTADTHKREPLPPTPTAPPAAHAAPRPPGGNLVTPADVGSRVTFQFELPNGFATEAVGVFERWDPAAETYFVRKKDGTEVRVPARGVRHGKVIRVRPAASATPTP